MSSPAVSLDNKNILKIVIPTAIGVVFLYEAYNYMKKASKKKKYIGGKGGTQQMIGGKGGTQQQPSYDTLFGRDGSGTRQLYTGSYYY